MILVGVAYSIPCLGRQLHSNAHALSVVDLNWMSWTGLGTAVVSVPLFALMRVDYYRLEVDTTPTESVYSSR